MNKDYKKLRNVILVLLILLAVLILANNGMLPSVKISRDDNSGYFVDMGDGGMEFGDEDEEEDEEKEEDSDVGSDINKEDGTVSDDDLYLEPFQKRSVRRKFKKVLKKINFFANNKLCVINKICIKIFIKHFSFVAKCDKILTEFVH